MRRARCGARPSPAPTLFGPRFVSVLFFVFVFVFVFIFVFVTVSVLMAAEQRSSP